MVVPVHPRHVRSVTKRRGLSPATHLANFALTVATCGLWGLFVWLPWWAFRMLVRRKSTTHYYYSWQPKRAARRRPFPEAVVVGFEPEPHAFLAFGDADRSRRSPG